MSRAETIVSAVLTTLFVTVVVLTNIPSAHTQEGCEIGCRLPTFQYVQVFLVKMHIFTATCFSNVAVMGSLDVRPSVCNVGDS